MALQLGADVPKATAKAKAIARRAAETSRWNILSGEWKMSDSWTNGVPCGDKTAVFGSAAESEKYTVRVSPEAHPIGKISLSVGAKLVLPVRAKLSFGAKDDAYCPYLTSSSAWKEQTDGAWVEHPKWTNGVPCGREAAVLPSFDDAKYAVSISAESHPLGRLTLSVGSKIVMPLDAKLSFGASEEAACPSVGKAPSTTPFQVTATLKATTPFQLTTTLKVTTLDKDVNKPETDDDKIDVDEKALDLAEKELAIAIEKVDQITKKLDGETDGEIRALLEKELAKAQKDVKKAENAISKASGGASSGSSGGGGSMGGIIAAVFVALLIVAFLVIVIYKKKSGDEKVVIQSFDNPM
jgi:hypothetical protein